MKIAITGEKGFLGYHLTQYLTYQTKHEVISLGKDYQKNIEKVKDCDWLIHCAGVNRGEDVGNKNIALANELVQLLNSLNIKVNVSFASSTQIRLSNEYGNSKIQAAKILENYCNDNLTRFISYEIPNLFGPFGKPNYNSVVATFCHNAANNIESKVSDSIVKLCYVYDAVKIISNFEESVFTSNEISVKDLHKLIQYYHENYSLGIIPEIKNKFELDVFNTYRSYANYKHSLLRRVDNRGYLTELLKVKNSESQIFFSVTKPGITRGNHFHFRKTERFCVLKGHSKICIRKVGTDETITHEVSGDSDLVLDMPVLHTHNITNIGNEELICVFWTNEIYDQNDSDTYPLNV